MLLEFYFIVVIAWAITSIANFINIQTTGCGVFMYFCECNFAVESEAALQMGGPDSTDAMSSKSRKQDNIDRMKPDDKTFSNLEKASRKCERQLQCIII